MTVCRYSKYLGLLLSIQSLAFSLLCFTPCTITLKFQQLTVLPICLVSGLCMRTAHWISRCPWVWREKHQTHHNNAKVPVACSQAHSFWFMFTILLSCKPEKAKQTKQTNNKKKHNITKTQQANKQNKTKKNRKQRRPRNKTKSKILYSWKNSDSDFWAHDSFSETF